MNPLRAGLAVATLGLVAQFGCSAKHTEAPRMNEPSREVVGPDAERGPSATPQDDGLVAVASTRIRLAPPPGFERASTFTGFQHLERGTSIVVTTLPGPYEEIRSGLENRAKLAEKGMVLVASEDRPKGEIPGRLFRVEQHTQELTAQKWLWVGGTSNETVLITGTCISAPCDDDLEALRNSILSAQWDQTNAPDPMAGLGFALEDTGGLNFQHRSLNNVVYGDKSDDVFFFIGPALNAGATTDQKGFARRRFKAFNFADISIESERGVEIDGLPGYVIVGQGKEPDGRRMFMYSAIVYEAENYWIAFGSVPLAERARYEAVFEKMAKSLRRERR
jgi:hypothetical protein